MFEHVDREDFDSWRAMVVPDLAASAHGGDTMTYLSSAASRPSATMRYMLQVRVLSLRQHRGVFQFFDHLEQSADFDDILVVDVGQSDAGFTAWAEWNSQIPTALRDYQPGGDPLTDQDPATGTWVATVPLPDNARQFLGETAAVRLSVTARE